MFFFLENAVNMGHFDSCQAKVLEMIKFREVLGKIVSGKTVFYN